MSTSLTAFSQRAPLCLLRHLTIIKNAATGGTPRASGTPRFANSPRASKTPKTPGALTFGREGGVSTTGGDSQMVLHGGGDRQLAVVPESPDSVRSGAGALVHVEVKAAKKGEVLVFPPFLGKAPKKLLKGDSGALSTLAQHGKLCWDRESMGGGGRCGSRRWRWCRCWFVFPSVTSILFPLKLL